MSQFNFTLIEKPAMFGRSSSTVGAMVVSRGPESFIVEGTRIHGENLTIDVCCSSGKDAYPSYDAALKALRMKSGRGQRTKRIYKCKECGCWHFTTNDGSVRKPHPYDRTREKEYARLITGAYVGQRGRVEAGGFSMKRFSNIYGCCPAAKAC